MRPTPSAPIRRLFGRLVLAGLAAFLLSALAASHACAQSAQSVWSGLDDRGSFWSYGEVVDGKGNIVHVGNWSGGPSPGDGADVFLGAPGNTICDVQVALDSLTLAPDGALSMDNGSSLTVATTNLAIDGTINGQGGTYTNTGTLTKTSGTGVTAFAENLALDSTPGSTIAAASGTLQLPGNGGLFDTVAFVPAAGTTISLITPNTATNTYAARFQGTLSNGTGTGTVLLSGGTMGGTVNYVANALPCTLAFTGNVFQWTGGTIGFYQQGAVFTNTGTVNISGDATKETDAVFTNQGTVTQSGAGQFNVGDYNSGGSFTNAAGAVYDLQSDANIGQSGYPFNNVGLFKKSGGTATSTLSVSFNNQGGTVEVDSGTLQLPVGQTSTSTGGTFNVAAGALLDLGDGQRFTGTFTGGGGGVVQFSQGALYGNNTTATILNFPGNTFQWTGGTIGSYQGGHLFTNLGTLNISGTGTVETDAVFTNQGTVTQSGTTTFNIGDYNSGGSFTNAAGAVYDLQSDANIGQSDYAFNNAGLFKKSGGTGTSTLTSGFSNQGGTVEVDSGTLQLPTNTGSSTSTGGTFNVAAGALLDLGGGGHFTGTYTGGGGGTVRFSAGSFYTDNKTGATLNFPGNTFQWTGGVFGGGQSGHIVINDGTINLSGDGDKVTYANLTNNGTMIQTGAGNLDLGQGNSGGSLTNAAGATYDLQSDAGMTNDDTLTNAGLFEKTRRDGHIHHQRGTRQHGHGRRAHRHARLHRER